MKVTVTGGLGFIGSATATAAEAVGHDVAFFDRRDGNDVLGDLSGLAGSEAVIHLAGAIGTLELFNDVEGAIQANIVGSHRIMQWCWKNNAQYVGILVPDVFPSIYCATKMATARLATALHHARGLKTSHVRTFNAFGPGQGYGPGHPRKFMPTFSMAGWAGKPIPVWGDGSSLIDPVHVDDVGRMLVDACQFPYDVTFDAGSGLELSVNQVAQFVVNVTKSTAGIEHEPMRIGETATNVAATGEGWDLLGWQPHFEPTRLAETVEWYQQFAGQTEVPSGLR
jgi:UDP-glucose 4-epimerase